MSYLIIERMPTFLCGLCRAWLPNAELWRVVGVDYREAGVCKTCADMRGLA